MNYRVIEVKTKRDLKRWVHCAHRIYQDDQNYIPQIIADEISFFTKEKNPAFEVASVRLLLALDENDAVVGRICGIINQSEEQKLGYKRGRFGWFETIDDKEISKLLFADLQEWFKQNGMKEVAGPFGFCDLDPEGLLIEGFDETPPIAGVYNKAYYQDHIESLGYKKDADYIEYRVAFPENDLLFTKMKKRLEKNNGLRVVVPKSKAELLTYAPAFWEALEDAFKEIYGVVPLSTKQQEFYTRNYLSYLDPEFVHFVVDSDDKMAGFFVGMPNMSSAFKKANGRLFPFGFYHLLKGLRNFDTVDFLLAGSKSNYPSKAVLMIMTSSMFEACKKRGIKYIETNRELEENKQVSGIWTRFESRLHRKSRIYKLAL
ncbi:MAG: hypothetical protein ISR65_17315 [Bacteriovoracaceae bacterium]|nr:hypothetical protein [Bacteriovoracaceae bacterium]